MLQRQQQPKSQIAQQQITAPSQILGQSVAAMSADDDDDFDFGDLDTLDLDLDEKAMLAGTESNRQSNAIVRNAFQPNPREGRMEAFNSNTPNHNGCNYGSVNQTKTVIASRDEFEDFGDLGDTDLLLDDNDLFEESPSSAPSRPTYFSSSTSHRKPVEQQHPQQPRPQQQQLRQQQQQQRKQALTPAPQPTKFFSIFGGANNQSTNNSNSTLQRTGSTLQRTSSTLQRTNPTLQRTNPTLQRTSSGPLGNNNLGGNSLQREGSKNNIAPIFQRNAPTASTSQTPSIFASHQQSNNQSSAVIPRSDPSNDFATDIFKSPELPTQPSQPLTHHVIDMEAASTWQYPINYPRRDYQYNIIRRALFSNTLVSLPTGLGKTFIAAVVMLNYFRWFPKSKIIFMAPTRPLVNQQIEACFNICGIPQEETVEMTGQQNSDLRREMWTKKRVIYCTPQVLQNDINSGICPAEDIVCLVVDEAHRAVGRYAYSEVIRLLEPINRDIRVMALTATPGGDIKTVQKVVQNLKIAKIEMRTEDSMDLQQYVFKRSIQEMVVPCGREVGNIRDKFLSLMRPFLDRLAKQNVLRTTDPAQLSRFSLIQGRDAYLAEHPQHSANKSFIMKQIGICMGLVHAYELLTIHGIRPFFANMDPFANRNRNIGTSTSNPAGARGIGAKRKYGDNDADKDDYNKPSMARKAMEDIPDFIRLMDSIRIKMKDPKFCSHPKLERLVGIVVQHFVDHQDRNDSLIQARAASTESLNADVSRDDVLPQTRVMIFANYRESVEEISRVLEHHRPLIKVQSFIGQATAKGKKGISQKEQQKVVADFQKGQHNVLVATSIGEEGLDIGDVDLIICYDSHSSPIRMLQRMGRTGRKRKGKICLLLSEGQEEQKYRRSQTSYKTVQRAIAQGHHIQYYPYSPRILPPGTPPTCDLVHINVPTYIAPSTARKRKKVGDDGTGAGSRSINQSAFLDPHEMARFQQLYRIPRREIRTITFHGACTKWRENKKRSVIKADKTFIVGHSTRTTDFVNTVNRIAKARVEQSLGTISGATGQKDSYSSRMMALVERWGLSGTGAEEIGSDVFSKSKGKDPSASSTGIRQNPLLKKSGLYSLEGLSDDDMEELNAQVRSNSNAHSTRTRRRLIIDESEDDDSEADGYGSSNDKQLSDVLFKTNQGKKVQPRPKRKNPVSKSAEAESLSFFSSRPQSRPMGSSPTKSIRPYFPTISDDEVDMEIMGGLGEVFEQTTDNYHDYDGYALDTPRGSKRREATSEPGSAGPIPSKNKSAKAAGRFDFEEPLTSPSLWYRSDERNSKDKCNDDFMESTSPEDTSQPFVLFELPQVPQPGQWYQPPSLLSPTPSGREQISHIEVPARTSEAGTKLKNGGEVEQEILLIESSQEEPEADPWTKRNNTFERQSVATATSMGFVSAREVSFSGANNKGKGKQKNNNFEQNHTYYTALSRRPRDSDDSPSIDNNDGDGNGIDGDRNDSSGMDDFELGELDLADDDSLLEEDTPW
ncbi:hypothetical protein BGZ80_008111 [Entomortierella chlamydospora]|uniref:ATP-dependent DNA helicase n=1 Tax=Entomortierella chlamydospora TaxID=101097 RepID=A0A9P6MXK5_9FUNG|nr:hypothetical protein BGZ80_008111 [Entomortierella chlamydospora]